MEKRAQGKRKILDETLLLCQNLPLARRRDCASCRERQRLAILSSRSMRLQMRASRRMRSKNESKQAAKKSKLPNLTPAVDRCQIRAPKRFILGEGEKKGFVPGERKKTEKSDR